MPLASVTRPLRSSNSMPSNPVLGGGGGSGCGSGGGSGAAIASTGGGASGGAFGNPGSSGSNGVIDVNGFGSGAGGGGGGDDLQPEEGRLWQARHNIRRPPGRNKNQLRVQVREKTDR